MSLRYLLELVSVSSSQLSFIKVLVCSTAGSISLLFCFDDFLFNFFASLRARFELVTFFSCTRPDLP